MVQPRVANAGVTLDLEQLKAATSANLGKTQRLSALRLIDELRPGTASC